MIYGYCRVSTKAQELEGNGLEVQEAKILERFPDAVIIKEQGSEAKHREKLNELIELLQDGDILVSKLDRLSRSTGQGALLLEKLIEKGVVIELDGVGTISNSPMHRALVNMLLTFAQLERDMIKERTMSAKEFLKETDPDFREGRPKLITDKQEQKVIELHKEGNTQRAIAEATGISKGSVSRILTKYKEIRNKRCRTCKHFDITIEGKEGYCRYKKEIMLLNDKSCLNYKVAKKNNKNFDNTINILKIYLL